MILNRLQINIKSSALWVKLHFRLRKLNWTKLIFQKSKFNFLGTEKFFFFIIFRNYFWKFSIVNESPKKIKIILFSQTAFNYHFNAFLMVRELVIESNTFEKSLKCCSQQVFQIKGSSKINFVSFFFRSRLIRW